MIPLDEAVDQHRASKARLAADDETDVRDYIAVFWRYRAVIAVVTLVSASVPFVQSVTAKRTYQATVNLLVNFPPIDSPLVQRISVGDFRPVIESPLNALKAISEFHLDAQYGVDAANFYRDVVSVAELRNASIFMVSARLPDARVATGVVNRIAELAVDDARRVSMDRVGQARGLLNVPVGQAATKLAAAEAALNTFRDNTQLDLIRKDVDAALGQRGGLLGLLVDIEAEKARLAKSEQELALRHPIETLKRTIDSDPMLLEAARRQDGSAANLLSLQTQNEMPNPVYEHLDEQVAQSRTRLAALERQKAELVDVRNLGSPQLKLLTMLYDKQSQLQSLEMNDDLARKIYEQASMAYEGAEVQTISRSAQLLLIEPAIVPSRPLSRNVVNNTLVGLMAGLMLSAVGIVVYEAIRNRQRS